MVRRLRHLLYCLEKEKEIGGGGDRGRRRGSQSANLSITVTSHLDPAVGHSFPEADRGADSVKYHKLVRGF